MQHCCIWEDCKLIAKMRYLCNMKIEMLPVEGLVEYARNARIHSEAEIAELVDLIREFGWTQPVLFDGRGIVAGHRRKAAAMRIYAGGELIRTPSGEALPVGTVPCLDVSGWTDAQRRAAILADNKSALNGGWDLEMLAEELRQIGEMDFDLSKTGFSGVEIDALVQGVFEDLPAMSFSGEAVSRPAYSDAVEDADDDDSFDENPKGHGSANYEDPGVEDKSQYGVIVICDGEMHQIEVFEKLQDMGYKIKVVVT